MDHYEQYVRKEWQLFEADPSRAETVRQVLSGHHVQRVLDVGCGAGQELIPFLENAATYGVGLDVAPQVGMAGRQLLGDRGLRGHFSFLRGKAEQLPYLSGAFDATVCRLALPYMMNEVALAEMSRVTRPGGLIFLKIHHPRFYVQELIDALRTLDWLTTVHSLRVLCAGVIYSVTGRQPTNGLTGSEIFQTEGLLRREIKKLGIMIQRKLPGDFTYAPSFLLIKK